MIKLIRINCPQFVGQPGILVLPRSCGKTMFRKKIMFLNYIKRKYADILYMLDTDAIYFIGGTEKSDALMNDISVFEKITGVCIV